MSLEMSVIFVNSRRGYVDTDVELPIEIVILITRQRFSLLLVQSQLVLFAVKIKMQQVGNSAFFCYCLIRK